MFVIFMWTVKFFEVKVVFIQQKQTGLNRVTAHFQLKSSSFLPGVSAKTKKLVLTE